MHMFFIFSLPLYLPFFLFASASMRFGERANRCQKIRHFELKQPATEIHFFLSMHV